MVRGRSAPLTLWLGGLFCCMVLLLHAREIPIYIEDSHAGSFSFFAQELDLEGDYTLILIDAHSDASGVPESDRIRKGLRQVVSRQQRAERIGKWRKDGVIQPFNWIEPLMPRPISKVIWIANERLSDSQLAELEAEAGVHLDWQTQVVARGCGPLKPRFQVVDWKRFEKREYSGNVVVSIDLDYYAQQEVSEECMGQHWDALIKIPGLKAMSLAVSRPWLGDDAQGYRLLELALERVVSVRNAKVQFEPLLRDRLDRSERTKQYHIKGESVPRLDILQSPPSLRELIVRHSSPWQVTYRKDQWQSILDQWRAERSGWRLHVRGRQTSMDGVWRMTIEEAEDVLIQGAGPYQYVRWWLHEPAQSIYNLEPDFVPGKAFADQVGCYVETRKRMILQTDDLALAASTWKKQLPWNDQAGLIRLQAEVVSVSSSEWTPILEMRVRNASGLKGALVEQMGSPYVFGMGRLRQGFETGPETLIGNDCANFIVYAMRRMGCRVPWANPKQLRGYLHHAGGPYRLADEVSKRFDLSSSMIERGLIVHLRSHVAAVWQDRGQIGKLDGLDLVIHHLSGKPEIIPLEKLMHGRREYEIYTVPEFCPSATMVFGGDVNLAGDRVGESPVFSETIQRDLRSADFAMINLECAVASQKISRSEKRFQFVAAPDRLNLLKDAGVDAVSLANNHVMDAGAAGLVAMLKSLDSMGLKHVGAGDNRLAQVRVLNVRMGDVNVALMGINTIETGDTLGDDGQPSVLCFPENEALIEGSIKKAKEDADYVIVLPHWGDEYTSQISDKQRHQARWLIDRGVDAIIGSHSHFPQPMEYYQGRPIIFSLGNLYFPNRGPEGFNRYLLLKLGVDAKSGLRVSQWEG